MKRIFTIVMTAALMVALAIPTFAAELNNFPDEYPDPPTNNYDTVIINGYDGKTYLVQMFRYDNGNDYPLSPSNKIELVADTSQVYSIDLYVKVTDDNDYRCLKYYLSNDKWVHQDTIIPVKDDALHYKNEIARGTKTSPFVYSTMDINDTNNELVFPLPPSIAQILTEEVPNLVVSPMMKTLSILVPFGVGLMALLICLPILRKVFYQFQVK